MKLEKQKYLNKFLTKEFLQGFIAVLFFAILIYFGSQIIGIENTRSKVEAAGLLGPIIFILIKSSTIIFAPLGGGPLYLIAEPLFGYTQGTIYLFLGDIIGYSIVFYISRIFGRSVLKKILTETQLESLVRFLDKVGTWQGLTLSRIALFSFQDIICYAAGLTKIPFWQYLLVSVPVIGCVIAFYMGVGAIFISNARSFMLIVVLFAIFPFAFLLGKYLLRKKNNN